uniref:LRRCT domain-containing protein n=1 Tax=Laticauda laticaudata TaxID=8630 RepID=A0A8C5SKM2_LATLA
MLYPKYRTNRPILKVLSDDILIISAIGSNGNIKQWLLWTINHFSCVFIITNRLLLKSGTMFVNCSGVHALVFNLTFPSDAEHLDLSQNNLYSIPWKSISSLWKLQVLLLSSNSIHKVGEKTFISLDRLHKLDIGRNDISFLGNSFSVGLISLHELILAYNKLQELQYKSFKYFENLQKLNLQNNNISSIEMGTFRSLTRLRQLYLQNNCLHALPNRLFSMLQHLEILNLEDNPWFCDCDLQRVFAKLHSVRRLILDDYYNMTCMEPHLLRNLPLSAVDTELCIAETATVLVITFTVFVTVVAHFKDYSFQGFVVVLANDGEWMVGRDKIDLLKKLVFFLQ